MPAFLSGPRRLTRRIAMLFALVFGLGAAGNALYTAHEQSGETLRLLQQLAQADARAISATVLANLDRGSDTLLALQPLLPDTPTLQRVAVVRTDGSLLSALERDGDGVWTSASVRHIDAHPPTTVARSTHTVTDATGAHTVVSWTPLSTPRGLVWLRTESDTHEARRMFTHILNDSLLHGAVALLVGVGSLVLALRRPLRSLRQCTEFAERLDSSMGETLPAFTGVQETDRLAQALNWASLSLYDQRTALAESQARTGAILDAALDAVITFDSFGNVIEYNPAAERMLGWSVTEAMQRPVIELLVPAEQREPGQHDLLEWLGRRFEPVIGHHMELDIHHRDGHGFPAQVAITTAQMKGRALFTAFIADISERKVAEEHMMKARDAAEAANRAKSDFLANMSHEIRTPMNAIVGMTELALDTDLSAEQREYLTLVKQSANVLLTLIDDILDFSKIEAGRLDFESIPFGLREVVGSIVRSLVPKNGKPVKLLCRIDPAVGDGVTGDPVRLRQVLTNLIGNALKFTERGSVELSVTLDSQDADTQRLRFAVRDTGIGIPKDKQDVIFEAFSQADTSTTRRFGGTGLGLAICSRLVRRMGGALQVDSQPGEGSTFHFTVPMARAHFGETAQTATGTLDDMQLLVIEPDAISRRHIANLLEQWQATAHICADLDAGIGAIVSAETEARCFSALLVAKEIAARDGWALVHTLGGQCATPLPILLLHGDDRPDSACLPDGIRGLVARSSDSSTLFDALMGALHRPGSGAPDPARSTPPREGLHVLLAEDNPVNQTLAVRMLERLGHRVDVAENGQEATERAAGIRYDLILMDVQMPLMGGFEATQRIRASASGRHIPIVAMTAHAMAGDRERCIQAGMDAYVSKPVQASALLQAMDEALRAHAAAAPGAMEHGPTEDVHEVSGGTTEEVTSPLFDRMFTLGNLAGDEALMHDIIQLFLRDYRNMLTALREAHGSSPDTRSAHAHAIKGTVSNFGAARVAEIASRLERLGPATEVQAGDLIAALDCAVEKLADELRTELDSTPATA